MLVTLLPRLTLARLTHEWKASLPMLVTLAGIRTRVNELWYRNAAPMLVTWPSLTV
jgi:hypothetical protein